MNSFLWALVKGDGMVRAAGNTVRFHNLYVAGSPGRLSDAPTNGVLLPEVFLTANRGAGVGPAPVRITDVLAHAV